MDICPRDMRRGDTLTLATRLNRIRFVIRLVSVPVAVLAFAPAAFAHSLEETVRIALTTNPAARAANEDVRATALELLRLEEDYLPTVDFSVTSEALTFDDETDIGIDRGFRTNAELSAGVVLFDGYQRANRLYRNAARLDGAILRRLDASETLALSVVQAYLDVVRHVELLAVSDANVARHIGIKRQVDEQVEGGRLAVSAAFEIEERLLAARLARLEVMNALADAQVRFETLTGFEAHDGFFVPQVHGLPATRDAAVDLAVANSFRGMAAATIARQREYERAEREGERLPTISLRAGVRQDWDDFETDREETSAFVGLSLNWQLYAGGRDAREAALRARAREAQWRRDEILRDVAEFAGQAWNGYQTGLSQAVLLDVQENSARSVVTQYREEFRAGNRTLVDLLDAERSLFNVRFEAINANAALTFAGYRILASQSRLAAHFGIAPSEVPLSVGFEARATQAQRPQQIFRTEIRALE